MHPAPRHALENILTQTAQFTFNEPSTMLVFPVHSKQHFCMIVISVVSTRNASHHMLSARSAVLGVNMRYVNQWLIQ